jgi:hypothetical protein
MTSTKTVRPSKFASGNQGFTGRAFGSALRRPKRKRDIARFPRLEIVAKEIEVNQE